MSMEHAQPEQVVNVRPLRSRLHDARTTTLVKTSTYELIRLVVHAGREIATQSPGEVIVQCLEGEIEFRASTGMKILHAGDLLHLPPRVPHAMKATVDSSLLVTILLRGKS